MPKKILSKIFYSALKSVDPYTLVRLYTDRIRSIYQSGNFNRFFVIGFGKAVCPMTKAVEDSMGDLVDAGIVITKYGHAENTEFGVKSSELGVKKIKVIEARHPVPDENGLKGTEEIIKLLKDSDDSTLVVCLISGGGSALLVYPYEGVSLSEKQKVTELLLASGADISELNTVRKHISTVKGGRLAEIAYPAKVISLILSDVIGDRLDVIASGPTSYDKTTYGNAFRILEKYSLINKTPKGILEILQRGVSGLILETPKEGNKIFGNVENIIIGGNRIVLNAAKKKAEEMGFQAEIITSELTGEARDVGKWLAAEVRKRGSAEVRKGRSAEAQKYIRPLYLISGGETTVTVKGSGLGGRNMELALTFAIEIKGIDGVTLLSAGTDGTDGPTDATGAIVDGKTVKKARSHGLNPVEYLDNNDSYNFFKKVGGLFITGPTGTNVMDIQIMVIE